jgi:hypothetical protein
MKNIKETFEGKAEVSGDDSACFGEHASFEKYNTSMIDWLDEQFNKFHGKNVKVSIEIEVIK